MSLFYLGSSTTAIDHSVSNVLNKANVISLRKSFVENNKNIETQLIASKFSDENGAVVSGRGLWPKCSHFSEQTNICNLVKANMPENCIIYINQPYMAVKNNKKMFYCDYQIIGQVIEAVNPSDNIESYVFEEREVKMRRPRYSSTSGEFLGLHETVGFIVCCGDD